MIRLSQTETVRWTAIARTRPHIKFINVELPSWNFHRVVGHVYFYAGSEIKPSIRVISQCMARGVVFDIKVHRIERYGSMDLPYQVLFDPY